MTSLSEPTVYVLPLMFTSPPLTMNQRKHWTYRARITREIHEQIGWAVRSQKVPPLTYPTVTLHWIPATTRRRDSENPVSTAKAALDGLVAAGVLEDDTPTHVDHRMPVIHPPAKVSCRLWLEVTAS